MLAQGCAHHDPAATQTNTAAATAPENAHSLYPTGRILSENIGAAREVASTSDHAQTVVKYAFVQYAKNTLGQTNFDGASFDAALSKNKKLCEVMKFCLTKNHKKSDEAEAAARARGLLRAVDAEFAKNNESVSSITELNFEKKAPDMTLQEFMRHVSDPKPTKAL